MMFFTLGHSNRSLAAFVALLREGGTEALAGVGRWPRSRRNLHFNAGAPGRREPALLTPGACPMPDGRILYPATPAPL